jgi:hypothetical protein
MQLVDGGVDSEALTLGQLAVHESVIALSPILLGPSGARPGDAAGGPARLLCLILLFRLLSLSRFSMASGPLSLCGSSMTRPAPLRACGILLAKTKQSRGSPQVLADHQTQHLSDSVANVPQHQAQKVHPAAPQLHACAMGW